MTEELAARNESQEIDRVAPREALERLVKQGEIEIVTTATGAILYIPQVLDE